MHVVKSIVRYFKSRPLIFAFTLIIILGVTLLSLVPPQILRIIVDEVIGDRQSERLLLYGCVYFASFLGVAICDFLKEIALNVVSQGISKRVKLDMLTHVNKMTYFGFTAFDSGTLEAYFSNDVDSIDALITSGVVSMIIDCFKIIGIIISIFVYSLAFGLITLALLPVIVLFVLFVKKRMFKAQLKNRALEGSVNNMVLENLDNIKTIKSYRIYDSIAEKYKKILLGHYQTNQSANFYDSLFPCVMQLIKSLFIAFIVVLATYKSSIFGLSIGMLVSSVDLITNLFTPIDSLGMELQTIQKSMAGIRRINDFFEIEGEPDRVEQGISDACPTLEFDNVSFSYDGKVNVIENFSFKLSGNQKLTLSGKSGSGKSTLFKLSYGLIKPTCGRVLYNGVDVYTILPKQRAKLFGIVYQDYFFSGGSIYDEISLHNPAIDRAKVESALKLVGLDRIDDVTKPLNENDYSTGELSLFNIARAIVSDAKVLFIDEMNAKIDLITAHKLIEVINNVAADKMILSINHYGELLEGSETLNVEELFKGE